MRDPNKQARGVCFRGKPVVYKTSSIAKDDQILLQQQMFSLHSKIETQPAQQKPSGTA